jgi:hypothetical protein
MYYYFLVPTSCEDPVGHQSIVASASAVFSSITADVLPEFLWAIRCLAEAEGHRADVAPSAEIRYCKNQKCPIG